MKSIRAQLLVTLVATAVAAGSFVYRGLPPETDIFDGAVTDDVGAVRRSICWGVDVNAKSKWGMTPLHWAATQGLNDVATLLIARGADVNAKNKLGSTPLHLACRHEDVAALLIASGADVNAKDNAGRTPLGLATAMGHNDIADLLRRHGARE